jgi:hypothetical protein
LRGTGLHFLFINVLDISLYELHRGFILRGVFKGRLSASCRNDMELVFNPRVESGGECSRVYRPLQVQAYLYLRDVQVTRAFVLFFEDAELLGL